MSYKPTQVPFRYLYSREEVAAMLGGVSLITIKRLEQSGDFTPIRLTPSTNSKVFYDHGEVEAFRKKIKGKSTPAQTGGNK